MRKMKRFAIILALSLICITLGNQFAHATVTEAANTQLISEEKRFCTATLEDNFADDCVLVVMTNAASLAKMNYSTADFPEINCTRVLNLS